MRIVIFATAWGTRHGGINAFNRDFAVGLATVLGEFTVYCAVPNPSPEDVRDAQTCGVTLVSIHDAPKEWETIDHAWEVQVGDYFTSRNPAGCVDCWIGHDVITGWKALRARERFGGQAALIHHMSYIDYQAFAHGAAMAAERHRRQQHLFQDGTARLYAVGPLLARTGRDLARRPMAMLIPGFPVVQPNPGRAVLSGITFGRMDPDSDLIKQGRLAVAGFAQACSRATNDPHHRINFGHQPRFWLIGLGNQEDEVRACQEAADNAGGRRINVLGLPYSEDRGQLLEQLAECNLALMLSLHEGFGLTGWEAIAAEVPLIVSETSGLYELIRTTLAPWEYPYVVETPHVQADPVLNPGSIGVVADKILRIASDLPLARTVITELKNTLVTKHTCTWSHTAQQFLDGLQDPPKGGGGGRNTSGSMPAEGAIVTGIRQSMQALHHQLISYVCPAGHTALNNKEARLLKDLIQAIVFPKEMLEFTKNSFTPELWRNVHAAQEIGPAKNHLHYANAKIAQFVLDDLPRVRARCDRKGEPLTMRLLEAGPGGCNTVASIMRRLTEHLAGEDVHQYDIEYRGIDINKDCNWGKTPGKTGL